MKEGHKQKHTLVFSLALNGYQWLYKGYLESHKRYATSIDADFVLVDSPCFVKLGTECCWLKIPLILAAMKKGYSHVIVLDADALVGRDAPNLTLIPKKTDHIMMAKGRSGRWNSGVIYIRNSAESWHFFTQVLAQRNQSIDACDSVGWGENGHIISADKKYKLVSELALEWNNTYDALLNDYIRHFAAGKLRTGPLFNFIHNMLHWVSANLLHVRPEALNNAGLFSDVLHKIVNKNARYFDLFCENDCFSKLAMQNAKIKF